MSEQRKTRSSVAAPERAKETGSASRADTTSHSHDTTGAEREQAGILGQVLPHGKPNALPGRELVKLLGLKDLRDLTQIVERERAEGAPICASTDSSAPGYYLADNPAELQQYIHSLDRRLRNMGQTRKHLGATFKGWTGRR